MSPARSDRHRGLPIVGWREWVRLPALTPHPVKAKVDTGARTSSLHAFDLEVADGMAHFSVHPHQRSDTDETRVSLPVVDHRHVRPSTGASERRVVVATTLLVGPHQFEAELTLSDRDAMGFRMLLGRTALRDVFLVDPALSYVQGRRPTSGA